MEYKGDDLVKCPVCGKHEFPGENSFDICPICGWENDGVQADNHNYAGGANYLSVNEARIEFFLLKYIDTQKATIKRRQEFEEEYHKVQRKYAGLNYDKEPIKVAQREAELDDARQKYINDLNCILQSITNDILQ
ncbi:CPCC family cysteine-rich protein [Oscillospiraceae bacterium 38-13]